MSWVLDKGLAKLRDQVDAAWPDRRKDSDGTLGNASHQAHQSDHNPEHPAPKGNPDYQVDAMDITHDPVGGADMQLVADAIIASRDERVAYLIHDGHICGGAKGVSPWKWRPYPGANPHKTHLHISVRDDTHDRTQNWAIGAADMEFTDIIPTTPTFRARYGLKDDEKTTFGWLLVHAAVASSDGANNAGRAASQAATNGTSLSTALGALAALKADVAALAAAVDALGPVISGDAEVSGTLHFGSTDG